MLRVCAELSLFLTVALVVTEARGQTVAPPTTLSAPREDQSSKNALLQVEGEYFIISRNNAKISGPAVGAGLVYAIRPQLALSPFIRQAYSNADNYSAVFTSFELRLSYALTGSFSSQEKSYYSGETNLLSYKTTPTSAWIIDVAAKQYLFNTRQSLTALSGFGSSLRYLRPMARDISLGAGAGIDRVSNSTVVLTPVRVFASVGYAL